MISYFLGLNNSLSVYLHVTFFFSFGYKIIYKVLIRSSGLLRYRLSACLCFISFDFGHYFIWDNIFVLRFFFFCWQLQIYLNEQIKKMKIHSIDIDTFNCHFSFIVFPIWFHPQSETRKIKYVSRYRILFVF